MRRVAEQERRKKEQEEEARQRRLCEESTSTPLVAPETVLPKSKGKGPELAPESEGVQESQRCDSCEKRNVECVRFKVCSNNVSISPLLTSLQDRSFPFLPPLPGTSDLVLYRRQDFSTAETAAGGGPR